MQVITHKYPPKEKQVCAQRLLVATQTFSHSEKVCAHRILVATALSHYQRVIKLLQQHKIMVINQPIVLVVHRCLAHL